MNDKRIIINKSIIHYKVRGAGKPVVLIHGFAEDSTVWDSQAEALEKEFLLIIPDLPGSRRSSLLPVKQPGLHDYAACIKKILQQERIEQCTMIGHSMGGYVTLAFAEKYPSCLKAMGLFHSSAYADDPEKVIGRKKAIEFIQSNGTMAFLKTSIPGLFYDAAKNKTVIETLLQKAKAFSAEALIQYYQAMIERPDRAAVLKEFSGSILFMLGRNDTTVPFLQGLQQTYLPSRAYIYILRNSAHMGMLEETVKTNKNLTDFLRSDYFSL